jgi:hypothetical protein
MLWDLRQSDHCGDCFADGRVQVVRVSEGLVDRADRYYKEGKCKCYLSNKPTTYRLQNLVKNNPEVLGFPKVRGH